MAKSYVKVNGDIREVDRASIKDQFNDYRIVKNIYAKVNIGGTIGWEKVLKSKPIYNGFVENESLKLLSVEDFGQEEAINVSPYTIDRFIRSKDIMFIHGLSNKITYKIDLNDFSIQNYANSNVDIDYDVNGNVYFVQTSSVTVTDINENTTTYNLTLQTSEEFVSFCADKDGFCYCLTNQARVLKVNPLTQQTLFTMTLNFQPVANDRPSVDDDFVYFGSPSSNVITLVNKTTGSSSSKITPYSNSSFIKTDNVEFIYFLNDNLLVKYSRISNNVIWTYSLGAGYTLNDYDISYNGNVYVIGNNGTNYRRVKLNSSGSEIFQTTPASTDPVYKLAIFPGNYGGGFWDEFIN